ncbi:MAG: Mth938-like domain-containing protein [Candidatus Thiodiazotropha sp. (ex Monitilora ramsayi)]|nr:Mth938-like domain-containing protein [Candidatus Thiodiazotropha sp. (ex Monitilora ramsayi)]
MKFVLDNTSDGQAIQRYAAGEVIINQVAYRRSLIVMPDRIVSDWSPSAIEELESDDFELLADLSPEIVLLGTGGQQQFPHPSLTQPLMQRRIGLEVMDTAAACRTYNILMAEGRRVAAALFMI